MAAAATAATVIRCPRRSSTVKVSRSAGSGLEHSPQAARIPFTSRLCLRSAGNMPAAIVNCNCSLFEPFPIDYENGDHGAIEDLLI